MKKNPLSDGDWVGFWVLLIKNPLKPIYGWVLMDLFTVFIEIFQSTLLSCNWSNLLVFIIWQYVSFQPKTWPELYFELLTLQQVSYNSLRLFLMCDHFEQCRHIFEISRWGSIFVVNNSHLSEVNCPFRLLVLDSQAWLLSFIDIC